MTVTILRTTGATEQHELPRPGIFKRIENLIGSSSCDGVNLRDGRVMFVDDFGYETETINHGNGRFELRPVRARKPVNAEATKLYHAICQPGTTHAIVGDVAIVNDADFGDDE